MADDLSKEKYFQDPLAIGYAAVIERQAIQTTDSSTAPRETSRLLDSNQNATDSATSITTNNGMMNIMVVRVNKMEMLDRVVEDLVNSIDLLVDHRKFFNPHDKTYGYKIAFEVDDEIGFLCAAKGEFPARICFAFLENLKNDWLRAQGSAAISNFAHKPQKLLEFKRSFEASMSESMEYFSSNPGADKIRKLQAKVDLTIDVMLGNIDALVSRGEKLEVISNKAEQLQDRTDTFRRKTDEVHCLACMSNLKMTICLVATVICAILSLAALGVGIYYLVPIFTG